MAPEKPIKEGMLSTFTTRQKVIAVVLVIIVFVIIWQIMGLFGSETPPPVAPPPTATVRPMTATAPGGQQMTAITPGGPVRTPAPAVSPVAPMAAPTIPSTEPTINLNNQMLETQKKVEQKYVEQLNQLQMLKVQREIAETNQAIASARLATVTAEKNVSDLLTRPAPQQVPAGAYAPSLVGPTPTGMTLPGLMGPTPPAPSTTTPGSTPGTNTPTTTPTTTTTVTTPPPAPAEIQFVVISVAMREGRWSAVLGYQGKLYSVSIGDVVPVDGSIVIGINRNGVILSKNGKRKRISIVSSI